MNALKALCFVLPWFFLCGGGLALADAAYLNDGTEIKGIVVEDYEDRIVISTYEGEKTFFKKDIRKILYDLMEQNLVELGDNYMSRRELDKAYFYYEKAHKLNPNYKEAGEKMNYILGHLFREQEQEKKREIEKRQEIKDWEGALRLADKDNKDELKENMGIRIAEEDGGIRIKEIIGDSPAFHAGLRRNDILVSVWGRVTGYMSEDEITHLLSEESLGETKLCIKRDIILKKKKPAGNYQDIIAGKLDMLIEGLTVVALEPDGAGEKAGLAKNDLIVAINGGSTRYMPLKDAVGIIEDATSNTLKFTVKRDATLWKRQ